jgi:sugar (pentulose or hexulose) kinase
VADRAIITLDIGKTHAKLTLWSRSGAIIARRSRANAKPEKVLDAAGIEGWLAQILTEFATLAEVEAIIPVAHGAAAALVRNGTLTCFPRDYEVPIPAEVRAQYDRLRAPYAETGSPALPDGLNLGAQLFAQRAQDFDQILLWPQYWSWLLSGVASSEVTSLGTHTDLWNPSKCRYSGLAEIMGWAERFPPLCRAGDILGPITSDWAKRTGLPTETRIHCGVHDSNAALVAARGFDEIAGKEATVLSTGTWFIAMRSPVEPVDLTCLPEARDCLVNVDVDGKPVPSARFMGGREIELLGERIDRPGLEGLAEVLASKAMILPTFAPGCGPFPNSTGTRHEYPQRSASVALYVALVADASLTLIGARDILLIEGRFAQAEIFVRALATLRPDTAVFTCEVETDVSFGALRLVDPSIKPRGRLIPVMPLAHDLSSYKAEWHQRIKEGNAA